MTRRARRPAWWNELHDQALAALTTEWQWALDICAVLRAGHGTDRPTAFHALEDLRAAQVADEHREPATTGAGHPAQGRILFRLKVAV